MKTPESKLRAIKKYNQVTIKSYALKLNRNTEADLISHLESKSGFSKYVKSLIRKDMEESKKVELDSCDKASYTCQHEIGKGLLNMENRKPIGVYAISNTMGISVYDIDYYEDTVLVGYWQNDQEIFENCKIVDDPEKFESGFLFGELFVPFSQVLKTEHVKLKWEVDT